MTKSVLTKMKNNFNNAKTKAQRIYFIFDTLWLMTGLIIFTWVLYTAIAQFRYKSLDTYYINAKMSKKEALQYKENCIAEVTKNNYPIPQLLEPKLSQCEKEYLDNLGHHIGPIFSLSTLAKSLFKVFIVPFLAFFLTYLFPKLIIFKLLIPIFTWIKEGE